MAPSRTLEFALPIASVVQLRRVEFGPTAITLVLKGLAQVIPASAVLAQLNMGGRTTDQEHRHR